MHDSGLGWLEYPAGQQQGTVSVSSGRHTACLLTHQINSLPPHPSPCHTVCLQKLSKAQKRREKMAAKDAEREARIAAGGCTHAAATPYDPWFC